jgi:hypothetical protein
MVSISQYVFMVRYLVKHRHFTCTLRKWGVRAWNGFIWLKNQWWAVVNTVMNVRVPYKA